MSALLEGVAVGDRESFTYLVAAFDADLLRLAFLVSGDLEQARDAVQGTWERLWQKPPRLRQPERLRSWLLTVAANQARQAARRRRRGAELEQQQAGGTEPRDPGIDTDLLEVDRALGRLSPKDRELVALRYLLDMTSPEIAVHMGLSPEGVRTRLRRALARLREDLADA